MILDINYNLIIAFERVRALCRIKKQEHILVFMREQLIKFIIYVISNEECHHAVTLWSRVAICIHIFLIHLNLINFYPILKDKVFKEKCKEMCFSVG